MSDKIIKNNILKILIGIPVALLFLSLFLFNKTNNNLAENNTNPYLRNLPLNYINLITEQKNDSTYFCSVIKDYGIRELIVIKAFPTDIEKKTNFAVEIYPTNIESLKKDTKYFSFNITNDAVIYNYKGKTYGIFRKAIPFIETEKIIVKKKGWKTVIEKPFDRLPYEFQYQKMINKSFQSKPNTYTPVFVEILKTYDISFLPYSYTIKDNKLFQVNEELKDYVLENKKTIGIIENSTKFWDLVNKKNKNINKKIQFIGENSKIANDLIESYIKGKKQFDEIININKLADILALKNVFSNNCDDKVYFLYNTKTNLLEPFFMNFDCLGQMSKNVAKLKIHDINFITTYIKALEKVSKLDIYEGFVKKTDAFQEELGFINSFNPNTIFDMDILNINQRIIKKSLDPTLLVAPEIITVDKNKMELLILNSSIFPIDILSLNYNPKKEISQINSIDQLLSGQRDTIIVDLPRSFENLFVSKKSKKTGFELYKHIYDLNISYSILGLDKIYFSAISPYQQKTEEIKKDLFRINSTLEERTDIVINKQDKIISFNKKEITISNPLIIPNGYAFVVSPGTKIDIVNGGKIISHAPLNFKGSKTKPIKIFSSDKKGQGIVVLSEGKKSSLEHVFFDFLTNPSHGYWSVTGAVTFYESPVQLNYVTVSNNSCEDALNIVRTTFEMKNCTISNTQSDAFDGDFVTGTITGSKFMQLGNDAIDVSGSDLKINNVIISRAGDKGLSAGEDSQITINDVHISDSEIAIAGKDLSIINGKNLKITNTKLAFTAFQKKPEFGPSNITVNTIVMEDIETKYLIENTSSMKVDGVKIETSQNVKDRMYGVEFGVSSEETRNSQ